jgi:hypothetical protein
MTAESRIRDFLSEEPTTERDASEDEPDQATEPDLDAGDESEPEPRTTRRRVQPRQSRSRDSLTLLVERPDARLLALLDAIARRIRKQPLGALAIAIGAGFVLGGALSFRTGRALVSPGVRHVGRELLKQLL